MMKHTSPSQESEILSYLETGLSLTPYQALQKFNCFRLASRCHRLKSQGHDIQSEWMSIPNGRRVKKYFLGGRDMLK